MQPQYVKSIPCLIIYLTHPAPPRKSYEQLRHQKVDKDVDHEVVIMRGGFSEFQGKFKDDGEIVEDWDKNVWGT